jgi:hypothetical protein
MRVDWGDVLKTIGSTTVVVAILGYVAQTSIKYFLDRDAETFKSEVARKTARLDRVRQEVLRWSNPVLGSVQELQGRLKNVLDDDGYLALAPDSKLNPDWSIDHQYFLSSTVFLFAQYFCWVHLLEERLNFELFEQQAEKDDFFREVKDVERTLASFPLDELRGRSGRGDRQFLDCSSEP